MYGHPWMDQGCHGNYVNHGYSSTFFNAIFSALTYSNWLVTINRWACSFCQTCTEIAWFMYVLGTLRPDPRNMHVICTLLCILDFYFNRPCCSHETLRGVCAIVIADTQKHMTSYGKHFSRQIHACKFQLSMR